MIDEQIFTYNRDIDIHSMIINTNEIIVEPYIDLLIVKGINFDLRLDYKILIHNSLFSCSYIDFSTISCDISSLLNRTNTKATIIIDKNLSWYNINLIFFNYVTIDLQQFNVISNRGNIKFEVDIQNNEDLRTIIRYKDNI